MDTQRRWECLSRLSFFVQADKDSSGKTATQADIDEEIFYLTNEGGFSPEFVESLPIERRIWYVKKLSDKIKEHNKAQERAARKGIPVGGFNRGRR